MSDIELQAANIVAPHMGGVAVFAVSTSSGRTNLAAAAQLGAAVETGRFVSLTAEGDDVWFFMNSSDAGTADEAATSGNNRTYILKDGVEKSFVLRKGFTWMVHKAGAACTVRAYISSLPPGENGTAT